MCPCAGYANERLRSLLSEQSSATKVVFNPKPVQPTALQRALVCSFRMPGTWDSKASSGVFLLLKGLLRPTVIIGSCVTSGVFCVNQAGCNSGPSAAAG